MSNTYIDENGHVYEYNSNTSNWDIQVDAPNDSALQKNIDLLRSHNKEIRIKATLLNDLYEEIESLVGRIKDINFNKTNSSLIRSTCSLTMSIASKDQINLDLERTWNKRMVKLECGILDRESSATGDNKYVWYSLGNMLLINGSSKFDATTQEVQLNLADLMASLAQERGSQIGREILIPAGSKVGGTDGVLAVIIAQFSEYKRSRIIGFTDNDAIPYDITINTGSYPIDMLQTVLDLFPTFEMFYDIDGWFVVQPIPTKVTDPVDIGSEILDNVLISESKTVDFTDIKNTTEVWGRELTADYAALSCETSGNSYHVTIGETFTELISGDTYAIVPLTDSVNEQKMKIQTLPEYGIYIEKMEAENNKIVIVYDAIAAGEMTAGRQYVIKYYEEKFILQGESQIRCIVQEITEEPSEAAKLHYKIENDCNDVKWIINQDNPYACTIDSSGTGWIQGEIRQVLSDGEYANIYTTQLAYERAEYENWLRCRMQDTVEVEMILVPWMDINDKIQYTSPVSNELGTWLVQDINYDFTNWTMTVKASRFYPYYPWD